MTDKDKYYPGMLHLKNEAYTLARDYFETLVSDNPTDAEAYAWLAASYGKLLENGSMLEKVMLLPLMEETVLTAIELNPLLPLARKVNGFRLLYTPKEFGGDLLASKEELKFAVAHIQDDIDALYGLGKVYMALNEIDEATKVFNRIIELDTTNDKAIKQLELLQL